MSASTPVPAIPDKLQAMHLVPTLAKLYELLIRPEQVVELRALEVKPKYGKPYTESGYFEGTKLRELASAAYRLTRQAKGVYFSLNPVDPSLLARRKNRTELAKPGETTTDADILRRQWLLVDADPVRKSGISASDEEKRHALDTILEVREFLRARDWSEPILSDSGNGYHLLFPIDLPANDHGLVQRVLKALAQKFDDNYVKIDQQVFNPARICKLPGTLARKGDSIPSRPHRQACILEAPSLCMPSNS